MDSYLADAALLHQIAGVLFAARKPYLIMADWNMPPEVLSASGWLSPIAGKIVATERPTCVTRGTATVFDYAVVS